MVEQPKIQQNFLHFKKMYWIVNITQQTSFPCWKDIR